MIHRLDKPYEQAFIRACSLDPALGARVYTLWRMYGASFRGLDLWVQVGSHGQPVAALSRMDGYMTISAGQDAGSGELLSFIQAVGCSSVLAGLELCRQLQALGAFTQGLVMAHAGGMPASPTADSCHTPLTGDIYHILCEADGTFAAETRKDAWMAHTSHLLRHGFGRSTVLYAGGVPASTGGVYAMGPDTGIIGGIATIPRYRGRGYARTVIASLCNWVEDGGRQAMLLCSVELSGYYQKLGFVPCSQWGQISIRNGN